MKVLHIIPSLNKGGAERLTIDICREQVRLGFIVKLIVIHSDNKFEFITNGLDLVFLNF